MKQEIFQKSLLNSYEVLEHLVLKFVDYEIVEHLSQNLQSGEELFKAKCKSDMRRALKTKRNEPEMEKGSHFQEEIDQIKQNLDQMVKSDLETVNEDMKELLQSQSDSVKLEESEIIDQEQFENELEIEESSNIETQGMNPSSSTELILKNINFVIEEESDEETPKRQIGSPEENPSNGLTSLNKQFPNEAIYEGQRNSDEQKHGEGQIIYPNGCVYEGMWENDKASGMGILKLLNGEIYEGEFLNNMSHGFGVFTDSKGGKYEGEWKEDLQHGYGVETWANGTKFQGHYKCGMKDGIGKIVFDDGCIYDGEFSENHISGYGQFTWTDGRVYEGEWLENSMNGLIRLKYKDGRFYQGFYEDDEKCGKGVYFYPSEDENTNGRYLFGEWKSGKIEGEGVEILEDGTRSKGIWINGEKFTTFKNPDKVDMKTFIKEIVSAVKMKKFTIRLPKPKSLQLLDSLRKNSDSDGIINSSSDVTPSSKNKEKLLIFDSLIESETEAEAEGSTPVLSQSMKKANFFDKETDKKLSNSTPELSQMIQKSNLKKKLTTIDEVPNSPNLGIRDTENAVNLKNEPDLSPRIYINQQGLEESPKRVSKQPEQSPDSSFEQKARLRTSFFGFEVVEEEYDFQKSMKGDYMPVTQRDFSKKQSAQQSTARYTNPNTQIKNKGWQSHRDTRIKSSNEYQFSKRAYGLRTSRSRLSLDKSKSRKSLDRKRSLASLNVSGRKDWYQKKLFSHRKSLNHTVTGLRGSWNSDAVENLGHQQFILASKSVGNLFRVQKQQ